MVYENTMIHCAVRWALGKTEDCLICDLQLLTRISVTARLYEKFESSSAAFGQAMSNLSQRLEEMERSFEGEISYFAPPANIYVTDTQYQRSRHSKLSITYNSYEILFCKMDLIPKTSWSGHQLNPLN